MHPINSGPSTLLRYNVEEHYPSSQCSFCPVLKALPECIKGRGNLITPMLWLLKSDLQLVSTLYLRHGKMTQGNTNAHGARRLELVRQGEYQTVQIFFLCVVPLGDYFFSGEIKKRSWQFYMCYHKGIYMCNTFEHFVLKHTTVFLNIFVCFWKKRLVRGSLPYAHLASPSCPN